MMNLSLCLPYGLSFHPAPTHAPPTSPQIKIFMRVNPVKKGNKKFGEKVLSVFPSSFLLLITRISEIRIDGSFRFRFVPFNFNGREHCVWKMVKFCVVSGCILFFAFWISYSSTIVPVSFPPLSHFVSPSLSWQTIDITYG